MATLNFRISPNVYFIFLKLKDYLKAFAVYRWTNDVFPTPGSPENTNNYPPQTLVFSSLYLCNHTHQTELKGATTR